MIKMLSFHDNRVNNYLSYCDKYIYHTVINKTSLKILNKPSKIKAFRLLPCFFSLYLVMKRRSGCYRTPEALHRRASARRWNRRHITRGRNNCCRVLCASQGRAAPVSLPPRARMGSVTSLGVFSIPGLKSLLGAF